MSVLIVSSPVEIRQAVAGALDAWWWVRHEWGTEWRHCDDLGYEYYVAHSDADGELEVYIPGGMGYDAEELTVGFEPGQDCDYITTPGGVAELLNVLGLPEVDA